MRPERPDAWHVAETDLADYAAGRLTAPILWSTEAHLTGCAACRGRLTAAAGPDLTDRGWRRLDTALDAPVPGPVERLLVRVGVPEHTGRLLAATPALRGSWLAAVAVTLTLAALLAQVAQPSVFLAMTPLLPLVGVAASFGPRLDPTHELTLTAPIHTFRLLLLRCVAVLAIDTLLAAAASLTMATHGWTIIGWFLPSLALTVIALLLMSRIGPAAAAATVGVGWVALVVATHSLNTTHSVLFAPTGQLAAAGAAVTAALVLHRRAAAPDTTRLILTPSFRRHR